MRRLYREYLYVPKKGEGIISEKVLLTRIALTIAVVVLILAQMAIAAYAHFLCATETSRMPMMTAYYDLDCRIKINGEISVAKKIVATEKDTFPKTYEVELTIGDDNTASTGFCIVTVDYLSTVVMEEGKNGAEPEVMDPQPSDMTYHTQQIGKDINAQDGERNKLTFKITLEAPATVRFIPSWGTSSNYNYDNSDAELYITEGETVLPKPLEIGGNVIERPIPQPGPEQTGGPDTETSSPDSDTTETSE